METNRENAGNQQVNTQIRTHIHDGNRSQRIQLANLQGYIQTVTAAPTATPKYIYNQFQIYNGVLYYYDFIYNLWRSTSFSANSLSVYAAGTAYSLTATPALLDFGTTDPSLVISGAGTWLISARVRLDYNAATFAAVRTATLKLRRTNNTAADLANSSTSLKTQIITLLTYTAGIIDLPQVIYTTTNTDDIIQIFGSVDVVPTAGSFDTVEASIIALRIA